MIGGWAGCKQGGKTGGGQEGGGQLVENKKIQESIIGERVNLGALGAGGGGYVNFTQLQVVTKRKSNSGDARLF